MSEKTFVQVRDLKRVFDVSRPWLNRVLENAPKQYLKAVDGVSFDIRKGETFALVGESGSGKSTVARMVVGLLHPSGGTVSIDGVSMSDQAASAERQRLRKRIQMIFQDPYASLNPRWRVGRIIAEPIRAFGIIQGDAAIEARVGELLSLVGLHPDDGKKFPHEFSGGQRQRIAIARALASNAEFIVCDEPTSALDVSVQAQILNLMRDLQEKFGLTYLFISHNLAVVRHMATRIGVMYLGRLVEVSDGKQLFAAPRHPYTRMLLDAVPDLAMIGKAHEGVKGEIPNPINPPSGCTFHPRCPLVFDRCRVENPPVIDGVACHAVNAGRVAA
ncbi:MULTISPECIES: oligopeptide/dipeptide ABC transporter ATP-binding protein [unclassified Bosea (in: a-proteobacteria)]|uniref:ABC transporter ATP-binding protein n=1 Tax=unclassified Bosea (in: a-proteobacteria) TaxID=2653178 RepID=UPI000F7635E9|nr:MULTISPECIES: oligopeptide/dipeptide ABC transporter ATP-binding protein [unclassified Bosea (in: a-proteobacteria)]AZO78839.1 ABC transporter ATP-binding protein [Bosea sp. Tri-49]RXT17371.1 ABC transporter ATP-binding protein [Bosea sp. Tri-39]RXT40742.1 ABC transporter ATP-binding protein [Bosea sp. Tri-54]